MRTNHPRTGCARYCGARLIIGVLLAFFGTFAAGAGATVPLSVYGGLPSVEQVALSPDGSRVAYVRTEGDQRIVVIATVADRKMIRWVKIGTEKLRDLVWADDDNVMLYSSITDSMYGFKDEHFMLKVYSISGNDVRGLPGKLLEMDDDDKVMNLISGEVMVRHVDGHTVVFVEGVHSTHGDALFRCDLNTRKTSIFRTDGGDNAYWLVDAQGQMAAEEDYDAETLRWSIRTYHGGYSHEVLSGHAGLDVPQLRGFGPTPDTLLVESVENGQRSWKLLSMNDGKFAAPMSDDKIFDHAMHDQYTGLMIGGTNIVDRAEYVFFDPVREARWKTVLKAFDGDTVEYMSASNDQSKILILIEGPKHGYRYELIDLEKAAAVPIGKVYAGIDIPLEVRRVTYAAADGMQIGAYLTLPRDKAPKNLPLIVLPHGGPPARDTADFDWWSQALAEQGYAVLRPNFRGSTVTESLLEAGYGQWGRKMQTDLSDGVRYLAKEGIADSARVCIVGASYGGYAALAGVTLDPGVYRCAVSVAGLSDLARMLNWEGRGGSDNRSTTRYYGRWWSVSGALDPALDAISPIKHLDAVKVPVLFIHGHDDTVVPYEQSQIMFDALKKNQREVEFVTLKQEDHWLSRGETRLQMLETSIAFLKAHNPPD
jgi:dipeptidyl aminopeptidase/acylaminoacyl peptidase